MRVTLSLDHIIKFIEADGLSRIGGLAKYKQAIDRTCNDVTRLSAALLEPVKCTPCAQKNLKSKKYVLLSTVVMAINAAKSAGESVQPLIDFISTIINEPVTQLDIIMPSSLTNGANLSTAPAARAVNARNSIRLQGKALQNGNR